MSLLSRVLRKKPAAEKKRAVRETTGVDDALLDALEWGEADSSKALLKRGQDYEQKTRSSALAPREKDG